MPTPNKYRKALVDFALRSIKSGISVVPLNSKRCPIVSFGSSQGGLGLDERIMDEDEVKYFFNLEYCQSLGWICGAVSNLTLLDFDLKFENRLNRNIYNEYISMLPSEIYKKTMVCRSKSNGMHIWLRNSRNEGSTHLARRRVTFKERMDRYFENIQSGMPEVDADYTASAMKHFPLIETRGKAGFGVAYIDPKYKHIKGGLRKMSIDEFDLCINIARKLDMDYIDVGYDENNDDWEILRRYDDTCDFTMLMQKMGHQAVKEDAEKVYYLRQGGSSSSHSGFLMKRNRLYRNFSTSVPMKIGKYYKPHQILIKYVFNNSYNEAIAFIKSNY